ncbi:aminoacyl-histidine dipeptidase [Apibacter sp. HY039]|uniref:aminoacyl-histidine dipeptidase n=1 Tax=Apibacter sp. HY039 TaxID=2501476 RepID=UPI000FEB8FA7|nr:aminoacyl-histidine dipeptidase [Apibacter sp. HY039]
MINQEIRSLEPHKLWNFFSDLNAVPRPSKKEEKVREFIKNFGNSLNLETLEDRVGNILIKKPATSGLETKKKVVLQSHLDMVCQKNNDVNFDFDSEGIKMQIEGDWVSAVGTTLGADNGIGVASIMAILASDNIEHPDIEALFTIDEETGMTGAFGLEEGFLSGDILLNLDTEEDDEIDIGCAGGIDVSAFKTYPLEAANSHEISAKLEIIGLHGGHSGMDIHKGLGNSNKLVSRFLYAFLDSGIKVESFDGGGLRNAIPREATVKFVISNEKKNTIESIFDRLRKDIVEEFKNIEENLEILLSWEDSQNQTLTKEDTFTFVSALTALHNGVFRMSPEIADLVEASNNIARVELIDGKAKILCLTRSSVESSKLWLADSLKSVLSLAGMNVEFSGSYPGWKPNPDSEILKTAIKIYQDQNLEKPMVMACHAGLECGIIGEKYPEMEMISFGPTIKGAHSPKEKVSISSVQKYWIYLLEILKNIPARH